MGVKKTKDLILRKEEESVEEGISYKQAVKDARYIFNHYREQCPLEAWDTLRKILFNPKLK